MRRSSFQFTDFIGQALQIVGIIQQTCTQPNNISGCASHALAEPQCSGVIFFRIVNRLERLGTDALHIPQVDKFVCRQVPQRLRILRQTLGTDIDCS